MFGKKQLATNLKDKRRRNLISGWSKRPNKFQRGSVISGVIRSSSYRADLHNLSRSQSRATRLFVFSVTAVVVISTIVVQTVYNPIVILNTTSGEFNSERYVTIINDYFKLNQTERFKPILNIESINSHITSLVPEIERIESIKTGFLQRSEIKLVARKPVVMWVSSGKKYYVDALGVPFAVNYFVDPSIVVEDHSGASLASVDRVANDHFIGFIGQTAAVSNEIGLSVKRIVIPPLTTRQLELYVNDFDFPIKLSTSGSVARQLSDASRAISFFKDRKIFPSYLDVRVERKVYYK